MNEIMINLYGAIRNCIRFSCARGMQCWTQVGAPLTERRPGWCFIQRRRIDRATPPRGSRRVGAFAPLSWSRTRSLARPPTRTYPTPPARSPLRKIHLAAFISRRCYVDGRIRFFLILSNYRESFHLHSLGDVQTAKRAARRPVSPPEDATHFLCDCSPRLIGARLSWLHRRLASR